MTNARIGTSVLRPIAPIIPCRKYEVMMSRVLPEKSDEIIESFQVLRNRQQYPVTVTNAQELASAIAAQMLNEVHLRKRERLTMENPNRAH